MLHAEDYEVVCAENGQEAIEKFGAEQIDLLLLDLGLPVKDGWTALAWLAAVNPLLPVIIITGHWKESERAAASRADALMEKPLDVPCCCKRSTNCSGISRSPRQAHPRPGLSVSDTCLVTNRILRTVAEGFTTPYPPVATRSGFNRSLRMKKKILVVDDDPQIRESLRKVLRAEGYEVVLAADGQEAIEKFNSERIDLLLLDLNLPDNSGWDIFGTITSLNPFLPIIIITGRQNQHELATGAGVGALMEKPLDVPKLLRIIAELTAEPAETRLKRLVGLHGDTRYVPPLHPVSLNANSRERRHNR